MSWSALVSASQPIPVELEPIVGRAGAIRLYPLEARASLSGS